MPCENPAMDSSPVPARRCLYCLLRDVRNLPTAKIVRMSMSRRSLPALSAIVLITFFGLPLLAQRLSNHYAVVLSDPAVADRYPTREATRSVAARDYQRQIELRQESLKTRSEE